MKNLFTIIVLFDSFRLSLLKQCGEGAFGMVMMGEAVDIANRKGRTTVAVKMLKGTEH